MQGKEFLQNGLFTNEYDLKKAREKLQANMNLYNVTKFSLYSSLLFISATKKIGGFTLVLPLRIIFDFFLSACFLF